MIARLEGVLAELQPTRVVIDAGGVGYAVHVPLSTFTELPDLGKTVRLEIHTHANDGAVTLFGFLSRAERVAFQLLLRASRVGPKLAQAILSGLSPEDLLDAIREADVAVLRGVPGVGTRTAERILLELRDRAEELAIEVGACGARAGAGDAGGAARGETLSALLNLGYPRAEAERVIGQAEAEVGAEATLETLVRACLKRLVR